MNIDADLAEIASLRIENSSLKELIQQLEEQVRLSQSKLFVASSEKRKDNGTVTATLPVR